MNFELKELGRNEIPVSILIDRALDFLSHSETAFESEKLLRMDPLGRILGTIC